MGRPKKLKQEQDAPEQDLSQPDENGLVNGLPVAEHCERVKRVVASMAPASYPWLCSILEAYEAESQEEEK